MSRRALSAPAAAALALAGLALAAGCTPEQIAQGMVSTVKVAKAYRDFTWKEELEIGGTVAAKLAASYPVVEDGRATDYVNCLAATVSACGKRPDVLPRVLILRDEIPNAYACPGGYMFVTTGLLKTCRDESELAGVLGHEFAHVAMKHTLESLRKKRGSSAFLSEAAKNLEDQSNLAKLYPDFKGFVDSGIEAVADNRHGNEAEKEADVLGAEWAARAGYDGAGLGRFIERLPGGAGGRWKEFSVYQDGATREQRIAGNLKKLKLDGGGATNPQRYARELAAVTK